MKYRIKFEIIDGTEGNDRLFEEKYPGGLECEGFCLLVRTAKNTGINVIHDMSIMNIADQIGSDNDGNLLAGATIGIAIRDAHKYTQKSESIKALAAILGGGKEGKH